VQFPGTGRLLCVCTKDLRFRRHRRQRSHWRMVSRLDAFRIAIWL
jgi:hypothetical protein